MIIVTGGAGFIGSAIIAALNWRGIKDILVVDENQRKTCRNLASLQFCDFAGKNEFLEMLEDNSIKGKVEAIFHMGACSSTTETDVDYLRKNNFEYTQKLATWAMARRIRFIYASSAATYGDGELGFDDDQSRIEELRPLNPYGDSKQMFDVWAKKEGALENIVGLKYFNVFGPNEYHKGAMRSFVLKAFEQIRSRGLVKLFKSNNDKYADGGQMRDFIYISDAVDMTLFFFDNRGINGLFNVGTGQGRTWNDLSRGVFAAMGQEAKIEYIDMPASIADQYQYFTQAKIGKIRAAGYGKGTVPMEDAIMDYVQNYLQKDGYLGGVKI
jgi:ADP-L-glycero-D-manno-heptose 6-epimerase